MQAGTPLDILIDIEERFNDTKDRLIDNVIRVMQQVRQERLMAKLPACKEGVSPRVTHIGITTDIETILSGNPKAESFDYVVLNNVTDINYPLCVCLDSQGKLWIQRLNKVYAMVNGTGYWDGHVTANLIDTYPLIKAKLA